MRSHYINIHPLFFLSLFEQLSFVFSVFFCSPSYLQFSFLSSVLLLIFSSSSYLPFFYSSSVLLFFFLSVVLLLIFIFLLFLCSVLLFFFPSYPSTPFVSHYPSFLASTLVFLITYVPLSLSVFFCSSSLFILHVLSLFSSSHTFLLGVICLLIHKTILLFSLPIILQHHFYITHNQV